MTGSWRRWHARVVRAGHADPRVRAARLALAGGEGAGHRRGARHGRHPVLPAAERANRPARGIGVRPGACQAAARAAGPAAAGTFGPAEGHQGKPRVTLPRPSTPEGPAPEGRAPEGRAPEGRAPEGPTPEGPTPEGRAGLDALLADP